MSQNLETQKITILKILEGVPKHSVQKHRVNTVFVYQNIVIQDCYEDVSFVRLILLVPHIMPCLRTGPIVVFPVHVMSTHA